jgi:peptide/nickel transport system permease protein
MYKYVLKRLAWMIPIIIGVSIVIFFVLSITPGDPGTFILGAGGTQEQVDEINHKLGYDLPTWQRYFKYMWNAVHLDLGESYMSKLPVIEDVFQKAPVSVSVAFNAVIASLVIGIPLGVLSAVKQYSLFDTLPTFMAIFLTAAPAFWIGLMLMVVFSLRLGWLPTQGLSSWKGYVLPMITLGTTYGAQTMRFTRSSMLETIRQDYIRTAKAKGASEHNVIWKHAMQNALLPVITVTGNNFGALLGGAIVTETLFGLPGLGTYIVNGIKAKDIPVAMGGTISLAILFSIVMLLVDLAYAYVDPRIKAKYAGSRG